jgi:hypothetical protein
VWQGPFLLRYVALLSLGLLAVHDLRYRLAFGGHADHTLEAHGHSYLSAAAPLVALLVLAASALLLRQIAHGEAGVQRRTAHLWLVAAAALLLAFGAQELIEGALATGHPAGVAAVLGAGGWIAGPVAVVVGGAITLLLRGAEAVLDAAGGASRVGLRRWEAPSTRMGLGGFFHVRVRGPLAGKAAGRAPPPSIVA